MRRSREQEPSMNVYPPPGEPAVRTDASDFIPCARMTPPRVGRAEGLSFAQLAVQGARIDAGDDVVLLARSGKIEVGFRPHQLDDLYGRLRAVRPRRRRQRGA